MFSLLHGKESGVRKMEIVKIEEMLEKEAERLYRKMKSQCKTYGELENAIDARMREEKWNNNDAGVVLVRKVMKRYREEVSKIKTHSTLEKEKTPNRVVEIVPLK